MLTIKLLDMDVSLPLEAFFFRDFNNSYIPHILKEIYFDRVYYQHLIGKRDLVIADFGANIGMTAYYFKNFAKQVYAVEPSKQHLEALNKMIEFNGITNIKVCPYAISNENGTTHFYHSQNTTMFSLSDMVNDKNDYEEVETVTVDKFMEREGIEKLDFLKCDLEGFESQVFSSEGFKKVCERILTIVFEYHTWTPMSISNLEHCLQDLGYKTQRMKTDATVVAAVRI